jgi:hypothetical protein
MHSFIPFKTPDPRPRTGSRILARAVLAVIFAGLSLGAGLVFSLAV